MKKIIIVAAIILMPFLSFAQTDDVKTNKELRKERKELRKQQRELQKSIELMPIKNNSSVDINHYAHPRHVQNSKNKNKVGYNLSDIPPAATFNSHGGWTHKLDKN
ncbi:MAG: hypothetical protein ACXIUD_16245 [Mongoliitalea sp.]